MPRFEAAFSEAENAIAEIKESVALIDTRQNIHMNAQQVFRFEGRDAYTESIMDEFFGANAAPDAIYRGLYIQLGSIFELFIKKCIEAVVRGHEQDAKFYEDIPEVIRNYNFLYSGHSLATIHEPVSGRNINFDEVVRKLGTCFVGNTEFALNIECFTLFIGNCKSSRVTKLMDSVNIKGKFWTDVGKQKKIQTYFDNTKAKETENDIVNYLDDYIETRNKIVHNGEGSKTITQNDVLNSSEFFLALNNSISNHMENVAF